MTASAQIDGRIDYFGTLANLNATQPSSRFPAGTMTTTSDYGAVVANPITGTWQAVSSNNPLAAPEQAYFVPTTGFNIVLARGVTTLILEPAGVLATGTVTFNSQPSDNQTLEVVSTQAVIALTLAPSSGQTISNLPTALVANLLIRYRYRLALAKWYRLI